MINTAMVQAAGTAAEVAMASEDAKSRRWSRSRETSSSEVLDERLLRSTGLGMSVLRLEEWSRRVLESMP